MMYLQKVCLEDASQCYAPYELLVARSFNIAIFFFVLKANMLYYERVYNQISSNLWCPSCQSLGFCLKALQVTNPWLSYPRHWQCTTLKSTITLIVGVRISKFQSNPSPSKGSDDQTFCNVIDQHFKWSGNVSIVKYSRFHRKASIFFDRPRVQ